ncbi:MAG: hypothetical protein K2M82_03965 [Lachnospiraceae bacterium]|nr:hypothetical protein [Lachnospiraceae bacterium]
MIRKFLVTAIAVLVVALLYIYFSSSLTSFGNISYMCTSPKTNVSTISFYAEEGDRLKFSFESDIENGDLEITLRDSNGNDMYTLDDAKELVTYFTLDKTDTYELSAEYNDFVGKFKVNVKKAD